MGNYDAVGLYDHNIESYEKIKDGLKEKDIVSIIHATGTGKSYNAIQLAYDNPDKKITYITPNNSIIEHLIQTIEDNPNLDLKRDFPNLEFRTYQSLVNMSNEELALPPIDILILDELHQTGAPVWGARIKSIVESHKGTKVLGMSAYTVRDRGTSYERDMVNPERDELFSNSVVSRYDLCDAIIDGVLPKPIYKSGYIHIEKSLEAVDEKIKKLNPNSKDYKELITLLDDLKRRLHEAKGVSDIFKSNISPGDKCIYFCPIGVEGERNDINTIMEEVRGWLHEMGLTDDDYVFYQSTSKMGDVGKKNRIAFYNDEDLDGNKVNKKLRIMFAINQYNLGVHAPGVNRVILGRDTKSDIVFFEQVGRALSVRGDTKKEYDRLSGLPMEELLDLCKKREIKVHDVTSKEEVIEKLIAPTIIDLAGNIGFIKGLEDNLKAKVKEIRQVPTRHNKRNIHLGDASFDIEMINEDLFGIIKYMNDRLSRNWMDKYNLAKIYYEHYGNLDIPQSFRTINGYEEDENGVALGIWINLQRSIYQGKRAYKMPEEQFHLLEKIGMNFGSAHEKRWMERYNLAKIYYEHYGNLEVPINFKTKNGFEYDDDGITLGYWIGNQRQAYNGKGKCKLTKEKVESLEKIGMRFEPLDKKSQWLEIYNLAKIYYEHYGNLDMHSRFKTINGYLENDNGIKLGRWIVGQRRAYQGIGKCKLTKEKIDLLEKIGMRFENLDRMEQWMRKYNLAKAYYEHHGNLDITRSFKTKNGYEYDEDGVQLGFWLSRQRQICNGKASNRKLTNEQIKLLEDIGMNLGNTLEKRWLDKYNLAKAYYEHYGNLEVPKSFKTINGYTGDETGIALGNWILRQRLIYNKKICDLELTEEQISLLASIGMRFESLDRRAEWMRKYNLAKVYYEHYGSLDIPARFKTINGYTEDENGIALGGWIISQRNARRGIGSVKISEEQIELLEKIGMRWYSKKNTQGRQASSADVDGSIQRQIDALTEAKNLLIALSSSETDKKETIQNAMEEHKYVKR